MINKVTLVGRLGADPELRYTQGQTAVCTVNIATTDYRKGADGQNQEMTEWHSVVLWGKTAENAQKFLRKGSLIYVDGRLQTRSWDDNKHPGVKRFKTEVVAITVKYLSPKKDAGAYEGGSPQPSSFDAEQFPSAGSGGYDAPSSSGSGLYSQDSYGGSGAPNLDDIPF